MRAWTGLVLAACLTACASKPPRLAPPTPSAPGGVSAGAGAPTIAAACVQTREHRDEDYTPGGLYAPGVADSAPTAALDISGLVEPQPRDEAPSLFGNRSPYTVLGKTYRVLAEAEGYQERGTASWYGQKFHGRPTSNREIYDMCSFSAAHKTLPLPSFARVTNLANGRSVVVRVNDRGPFHPGRIIDLSYAAAVKLGVDRTGTAPVEVEALAGGGPRASANSFRAPSPTRYRDDDAGHSDRRQIVQVGSYGEEDNARRVADRLEGAGIGDVEIEDARIDGRKLWRVRVGPVAAAVATRVLERIHALGLSGARLFSE